MPAKILTDAEKAEKHEKKKQYLRDYQCKKYNSDKEVGANMAQLNYHKRTGAVSSDDVAKYGELSSYIAKSRKAMDYIKEKNPELLKEFVQSYLEKC